MSVLYSRGQPSSQAEKPAVLIKYLQAELQKISAAFVGVNNRLSLMESSQSKGKQDADTQ